MNIEVNNLSKSFSEFALKNITFSVPKGQIVGLIGENGAGKTTLIKCILNIMRIDKGEVLLFGSNFNDDLKKDIGVVFDNSFVNEKYNAKDINLIMKNIHENWQEKEFFNYMQDYNIPINKELKKLSTGMKKKIEIAVCLSFKPKLLLLDEPTSGLDPIIRSEILDMFQNFVKDNDNSILLSTHITSDLEHIADKVVFISNGEVILENSLDNIHNNYVILTMNEEEFNSINKDIVLRYKENKNDIQVLIDKNDMNKNLKKYIKGITTLDDIMILYIRGKKCQD